MSGLDEKGLEAARAAFYGPKGSVVAAIGAYLAAATPAYVGEEPVAWRWKQKNRTGADAWVFRVKHPQSSPDHYVIDPLYSATALDRVVRERDEALEDLGKVIMACPPTPETRTSPAHIGVRVLRTRLESTEAKLAEARKVIEPFARAADNAERLAGHDGPLGQCVELEHLRAARRFLEETK